jgi:hypothetical protein
MSNDELRELEESMLRKYNPFSDRDYNEEVNATALKLLRTAFKAYPEMWVMDARTNDYRKYAECRDDQRHPAYVDGITPEYDAELHSRLRDRKEAPYTGTKEDTARVNAIFNRLEVIGGYQVCYT